MAPSAKFWDKIAVRYSKRPVADETTYQKKLQITRDYFTAQELEGSLTAAGFEIDHRWLPGKGKTVFIVAKKAANPGPQ